MPSEATRHRRREAKAARRRIRQAKGRKSPANAVVRTPQQEAGLVDRVLGRLL